MGHGTTLSDDEVRMLHALIHGATYRKDLSVLARSQPFASFSRKVERMHRTIELRAAEELPQTNRGGSV